MYFNIQIWINKFRNNFLERTKIVPENKTLDSKYQDKIETYCIKYNIDPILGKAIIMTESSFVERAYRYEPDFYRRYILGKGEYIDHPCYREEKRISASYGLMQIMYTSALEEGFKSPIPEDLYDVNNNLNYGFKHLAKKIKLYGLIFGILSYNSGSPKNKNGNPEDEPNFKYLIKVSKYYRQFGGINTNILKYS